MTGHRLSLITDLDALAAMSEGLDALARACGARAFTAPSFLLPWARRAVQDGQRPHCLALHDGADLAAFLPLFVRRDRKALLARRLAPPKFGSSPPFELLIAPGTDRAKTIEAMAARLVGLSWLDQSFTAEPADSLIAGPWTDHFADRGHGITRVAAPGYCLVNGAANAQAYLDRLKRKDRKELQRVERRLMERGAITLYTGDGDIAPHLATMESVIGASWKASDHMRRKGTPLLAELARSLASDGRLRLWFAQYDGRPVAVLMEIADESGSRHAYFNAQDPAAKSCAPGLSLLFRAVRASLDAGVPQYDFWGSRSYLTKLATGQRNIEDISIWRPGPVRALQRTIYCRIAAHRARAPRKAERA